MVHKVTGSPRYYASVALVGRRTLRVSGFQQKRPTEQLERHLEQLAALRAQRERPDRDLQQYLDALPDRIQRRLVKLDLAPTYSQPREALAAKPGELALQAHIHALRRKYPHPNWPHAFLLSSAGEVLGEIDGRLAYDAYIARIQAIIDAS